MNDYEEGCRDGRADMLYDELKAKAKLIERLHRKVRRLQQEADFLACLEAAGVDGWDGYEVAQELFDE